MRKIVFSILAVLAFSASVFAQKPFNEPAVLSESVLTKLSTIERGNYPKFQEAYNNKADTIVTVDDLKTTFEANKGKSISIAISNVGYLEQFTQLMIRKVFDSYLDTLSKEDKLLLAQAFNNTYWYIKFGFVKAEDFENGNAAKYLHYGSSFRTIGIWECVFLDRIAGNPEGTTFDRFCTKTLANGRCDARYQEWFKNKISKSTIEEAKSLISAELRAFIKVCNPEKSTHNKWLTALRVMNTSYSEL